MSCRIMSCSQNDRRVPSQIIFAEAGTSNLIEVKLPSLQPKTEAPGTSTEKKKKMADYNCAYTSTGDQDSHFRCPPKD